MDTKIMVQNVFQSKGKERKESIKQRILYQIDRIQKNKVPAGGTRNE